MPNAAPENPARLLPEGLRDVLPPQAEAGAALLRRLLDAVTGFGYERVAPPMVEFEETLLEANAATQLFRIMDPVTQRMMALRADMTGQVARIASDRLGHYARPLRLAYAGTVLRVKGTQLRADRQFQQAGAELVGSDSVAAVAEVIAVAVDAVHCAGLEKVAVDLTLPDFVGVLAQDHGIAVENVAAIRAALDAKDAGRLQAAAGTLADIFAPLVSAAGEVRMALAKLQAAYLTGAAAAYLAKISLLVDALGQRLPDQQFTLDPAEFHGFQYQTWIGFSLFAKNVRGEVGRGGAYVISAAGKADENAVGFSVYLNGLVDAGAGVEPRQRVFLPAGTADDICARLRGEGWVTVQALDPQDSARAQRCSHVWDGAAARTIAKH
jgi:ATP phosphoribosyltransferase regulatory subunit